MTATDAEKLARAAASLPPSGRVIARALGVSEKTVRNDLRALPRPPRHYVRGADGKRYPSTPARTYWTDEDGTPGAVITPAERRGLVVAYRRAGLSLRGIAARLGVSHEQVRRDLSRADTSAGDTWTAWTPIP